MKIICIGKNYHDHNRELNNETPAHPLFFMKPDTALLIRNRPFFLPDFSNQVEHEIELTFKICKSGKNINRRFAHNYYQEIGVGIDFTARDLQNQCAEEGNPWEIAKSFDSSAVISEFVPKENFLNLKSLNFKLLKNGVEVQKGSSKEMIFGIDEIIEHISKYITLRIGDIIFTGTPAGVSKVAIDDHLEGWLEEQKLLDFWVK